jgi:uncharacterized metal-binding protein YceD (DUF177 family)
MTTDQALPSHPPPPPLATAQLLRRKHTAVAFAPDAATRAVIARVLDLTELPSFKLSGEVTPAGKHDLLFTARITARVLQPCSVTLAPVETRIDEPVLRRYIADFHEPDGTEVEMSEDDTVDPLTDSIDVAAVAIEALALALPLYPRAPGADLGVAVFAGPGAAPLRDADLRPFAGLAALVSKANNDQTDTGKPGPDNADAGKVVLGTSAVDKLELGKLDPDEAK